MKANRDKWNLLLIKNESCEANINENNISNSKFEKLLGVTFDNRLNFNHHISKRLVINPIPSLEFQNSWIKIKERYFLIQTFYLNLITVSLYE